jgi:hypothetical protein
MEALAIRMRIRSAVTIALLAALSAVLGTTAAWCGAWVPAPGEYAFSLTGSRYSSDDIRNLDGERRMLTLSGLDEQRTGTASLEMGWKKSTSFWLELPFASETRRLGNEVGGFAWPTATGFGDVALGLRRRLSGGGHSVWSVEVGWKAPMGYPSDPRLTSGQMAFLGSMIPPIADSSAARTDSINQVNQMAREAGNPTFGQGQQDFQGMVLYGQSLSGVQGFFELGAGYRYRSDDPADQVLLAGNFGFWLGHSLFLSARYTGQIAVGDGATDYDKYTEHLIGPELRFRVDERCDFYVGSQHTPAGENVLQRDVFYAGIALRQTKLNRLQGFLGGARKP